MYVRDGCSYVVLNASISYNDGYGRERGQLENHVIKLLEIDFIIFFFIRYIERKSI